SRREREEGERDAHQPLARPPHHRKTGRHVGLHGHRPAGVGRPQAGVRPLRPTADVGGPRRLSRHVARRHERMLRPRHRVRCLRAARRRPAHHGACRDGVDAGRPRQGGGAVMSGYDVPWLPPTDTAACTAARLRCDWVLRHLYERGVDVAVAESVEAAFAVAALVRRELEAPADRDALWRDYEEARDKVIDHASLWGAGAAEKAPPLLDALDAAVRALAAAPPAPPAVADGEEREADIRVHAVRSVCGCRCEQVASGEWRTVEPCEHHDEAAAMERAKAAAPFERQGEEA